MPTLEPFSLYCQSLDVLVEEERWQMVFITLEKAIPLAKALHQYQYLGAVLSKVPLLVLKKSPKLSLWLQILAYGRKAKTIIALYPKLEKTQQQDHADIAAWAYWRDSQKQKALKLLENQDSGLAWRLRGEMSIGQANWQQYFQIAITKLKGRALGICHMEYGNACFFSQDLTTAQTQYNLAYHALKNDRYYAAWLKYNLGVVSLELGLPEAESHLFEVYRQSQHPKAAGFECRAWIGLGAVRRRYVEWHRAVYAYTKAVELATELDDRLDALCGLAQTWRCLHEINNAIDTLHQAIDLDNGEKNTKIRVLLAAAHLQRGEISHTKKWLENIGTPTGETALRLLVLQAEIQRLENKTPVDLRNLPLDRRCIEEEKRCFPTLFAVTLAPTPPMRVEVRALGVLEVRVGGRPIWLKPTSRAAELLVFLLEHRGHASSEMICAALYPNKNHQRNAEKTLWTTALQLRDAFGWEDSIKNIGKAYQLDPILQKHYDAGRKKDKSRLLEGVYRDWLEDIRRS
jgi:DNA-binding SARP family transcriptional activator